MAYNSIYYNIIISIIVIYNHGLKEYNIIIDFELQGHDFRCRSFEVTYCYTTDMFRVC
jgi:hypothetical protein